MERNNGRGVEFYKSEINSWAEFDARRVVYDGDTRGKWAEYRLGIITGYKNRLFKVQPGLARELYESYVSLLDKEIKKLDGNKAYRRYGSVPPFTFNKKERRFTFAL